MIFDVQVIDRDGWLVVAVVGDIDVATLPRLCGAMEQLEAAALALDLRHVDWLDPVCLGIVLAAGLRARRREARFVVVAGGAVAALLAETRVDQFVVVVDELPGPSAPG